MDPKYLCFVSTTGNKQTRNIAHITEDATKKRRGCGGAVSSRSKLDVALIDVIFKNQLRIVKRRNKNNSKQQQQQQQVNGTTNGHHATNGEGGAGGGDDDDEAEEELVIDQDETTSDSIKQQQQQTQPQPEFLRYFENKSSTPCYVPERLAFVKLTAEQINKHHLNLMSQNRKRLHEQTTGAADAATAAAAANSTTTTTASATTTTTGAGATTTKGPQPNSNVDAQSVSNNKRSLLTNNATSTAAASNKASQQQQQQQLATSTTPRLAQRSTIKPTQSINLLDAPEDIFYVATNGVKQLRAKIPLNSVQKLARQPYKLATGGAAGSDKSQLASVYESMEKLKTESLAKCSELAAVTATTTAAAAASAAKQNGSENGDAVATAGEKATTSVVDQEKPDQSVDGEKAQAVAVSTDVEMDTEPVVTLE